MSEHHEHDEAKKPKEESSFSDLLKKVPAFFWILLIAFGIWVYFDSRSPTPTSPPAATAAPVSNGPTVIPRGSSTGNESVVSPIGSPVNRGQTQVIVTAPSDYDVNIQVVEY